MSAKCDGTWITRYRTRNGTVRGHCKRSIQTVLNDNKKNMDELRTLLKDKQNQLDEMKRDSEKKNPDTEKTLGYTISHPLDDLVSKMNQLQQSFSLLQGERNEIFEKLDKLQGSSTANARRLMESIQDKLNTFQSNQDTLVNQTKGSTLKVQQLKDSIDTVQSNQDVVRDQLVQLQNMIQVKKDTNDSNEIKLKLQELQDSVNTIPSLSELRDTVSKLTTSYPNDMQRVEALLDELRNKSDKSHMELTNEVKSIQQQYKDAQEREKEYQARITNQLSDLEQARKELQDVQSVIQEKDRERQELVRSQSDEQIQNYTNVLSDLQKAKREVERLTTLVSSLENQNRQDKSELDRIKQEKSELALEKQRLTQENRTLVSSSQQKVEEATQSNQTLLEQIKSSIDQINLLTRERDEARDEKNTLDRKNKDIQSRVTQLVNAKQDHDTNHATLVASLQQIINNNKDELERVKSQVLEYQALVQEKITLQQEKDTEANEQIREKQMELDALRDSHERDVAALNKSLEESRSMVSTMVEDQKKRIRQLEEQLSTLPTPQKVLLLQNKETELQIQIESLTNSLSGKESIINKLESQLEKQNELIAEREALRKQVEQLSSTHTSDKERALLVTLTTQVADKDNTIRTQQDELEQMVNRLDETNATNQSLKKKVDVQDKEIETIKTLIAEKQKEVEQTKRIMDQTVSLLQQAANSLEQTPYKKLADSLQENLLEIQSNRPFEIKPLKLDEIVTQNKTKTVTVEQEEYKLGSNINDVLQSLNAKTSTLIPHSKEQVYDEYKSVLKELVDLEETYFALVLKVDDMTEDVKRMIHNELTESKFIVRSDDNTKKNSEGTFLIYSFLATALFLLTRTFIRLPTVLRMLSMEGKEDGVSPQNVAYRNAILRATRLNTEHVLDDNAYLKGSNRDLYNTFQRIKRESNHIMRIDSLAYYLLLFINKASLLENTSTAATNLFTTFDLVSKAMISNITSVYKAVNKSSVSALDVLRSNDNSAIRQAHTESNPVITLVKIRVDGLTNINVRFDCHPLTKEENEVEKHIMHLRYCDFDYRKGPGEGDYGNSEFMANGFPFYYTHKKENSSHIYETCERLESIIPYNNDLYFGPFTRVYAPHASNSDIVNDPTFVESIETKLRDNKPVCMIGYGASGSGKTSTLVYFRPDIGPGQDGILSLLSKKLSDKFDKVSIKVYEFEGNVSSDDPVADYYIRKYPPEPDAIVLDGETTSTPVIVEATSYIKQNMSDDENKKLDPNNTNDTAFEYTFNETKKEWVKRNTGRLVATKVGKEEYERTPEKKRFTKNSQYYVVTPEPHVEKNGTPILMATDIVDFMDNKRSIAATANNPVSSRSHVVIFISYSSSRDPEQPSTELVLCDFAGVEDDPNCNLASTLSKLGNIPIKNDPNDTPFYEARTNGLKSKKYNEYITENEGELQQMVSYNNIVKKNVAWLFNELRTNPLPIKEDKMNAPGISAEIAEKMYQAVYPGSPMNPLDFLGKLKMLHDLKDSLLQTVSDYLSVLNDATFGKGRHFSPGRIRENAGLYTPTLTVTKNLKETFENATVSPTVKMLSVVTDIPAGEFKAYPVGQQPVEPGLTKTIKTGIQNYTNKETSMYVSGTDTQLTLKPLSEDTLSNWINSLLSLVSCFGAELFVDYDQLIDNTENKKAALLDKKKALQLFQYMFEYGIIGVKTINEATPTFMVDICKDRVKEGKYINKSLEELRSFISQLVKSKSKGFPAFIDQCAPIQCNPSYKNCFGINDYDPYTNESTTLSSLAQQIQKVKNAENITYCILCVVNLSRTSANNPPVAPYINITSLTSEYDRLQLVQSQYFMNRDDMKQAIGEIVNGQLLTTSFVVNPEVLHQLRNHRLLTRPLSQSFVEKVQTTCDELLQMKGVSQPGYLDKIKMLIGLMYNSNAITTIGTLEFTNAMSNFGNEITTCRIGTYNPITNEQEQRFLDGMNGYMSAAVYKGLVALEKRNKILRDRTMPDGTPSTVSQLHPFKDSSLVTIPRPLYACKKGESAPKGYMCDPDVVTDNKPENIQTQVTQVNKKVSTKGKKK
jgi:chromosome segregation ATPase